MGTPAQLANWRRADAKRASNPTRLAQVRAKARRVRERNAAIINAAKAVPCMRCGGEYPPCVMDFHHRDRAAKVAPVARLGQGSESRLRKEIEKCDVLCANCHRIVEHS